MLFPPGKSLLTTCWLAVQQRLSHRVEFLGILALEPSGRRGDVMTQTSEDPSRTESPLAGCTVLITRPQAASQPLADRVRALGGRPLVAPLIEVTYPDQELTFEPPFNSFSDRFDAVAVTSANAVRGWMQGDALNSRRQAVSGARWFVVGERTQHALQAVGIDGDVPEGCKTGQDLAVYLAEQRATERMMGSRILYLRGSLASPVFRQVLSDAGWQVTECICYEVRSAPWPDSAWQAFLEAPSPRAVLLFSPSAVQTLVRHLTTMGTPPAWLHGTVITCVGTTTAKACTESGLPVHAIATRPDQDALLSATVTAVSDARNHSPFSV
ncbi:uroporphyrinogen-III synthase [Alicyclobacillus sp. ALC3]|uniref:uroporphyrinogen-III synthase n=1 Tax=Alicyclobacillus sp. ALC3 TaxID=2796143 RepID=UPI002378E471|nr:uroporphyrinogen-III synthase [Alicyclobacillus sp. ALC3]WDL96977.1 uroporphyrinogen-III synthase [Alicyclobacillus sp. ALC3]